MKMKLCNGSGENNENKRIINKHYMASLEAS